MSTCTTPPQKTAISATPEALARIKALAARSRIRIPEYIDLLAQFADDNKMVAPFDVTGLSERLSAIVEDREVCAYAD